MKKQRLFTLALVTFALVLLTACATPSAAAANPTNTSPPRPNIIFILTDDQDVASLAYMPNLKTLLTEQGATFANFFVNVSLCCPSRTTIMRGQYSHNTQIYGNQPPEGGFEKFHQLGAENSTVATWLDAAGYRTAFFGKYLNGYPEKSAPTYVPPGWDEWYSPAKGNAYGEFNYTLNENGALVAYGTKPEDYGTDVYARKAVDFIQRAAKDGQPFFVYVAPYAPHSPATAAPRHAQLFANVSAPRTPGYDEADVSDKPDYIRNRPQLNHRETQKIDADYRQRLQSLQAVDEMIESLVATLQAAGQLDNTYIFFTSDNGFHLGQHRLTQGKYTPYEEDIRVPMIVRGPGIAAGRSVSEIAGNVDFAPTFAELAGATIPEFVDGRSFAPLLKNAPVDAWRQAFLLEHGDPSKGAAQFKAAPRQKAQNAPSGTLEPPDASAPPAQGKKKKNPGSPVFQGLRAKDYVYIEYATGERELYDLRSDPHQLQNLAAKADPAFLQQLAARLAELRRCAAATCRTSDSAPLPALP